MAAWKGCVLHGGWALSAANEQLLYNLEGRCREVWEWNLATLLNKAVEKLER